MFEGFELTEVAGAFLYRKPAAPPRAEAPAASPTPAPPPATRYAPGPVRHVPARDAPRGARVAFSTQELLDAIVQLCGAGRFAEARERLERRLAGGGEGGDGLAVRLTLANLLGILREPEEAEACYRAALAQEPLSAEAHLFYGLHLLGQKQLEEAARELARALFLDPDAAMAHYFLGRCREGQGDLERARRCYRNAIDAHARQPAGRSHPFVGFYPDLPEDGAPFARAAEYALEALGSEPRGGRGGPADA
jgi:chemotaxis protein methyltransferase CheR